MDIDSPLDLRAVFAVIASPGYPQIADRAADVFHEMEFKERVEVYNDITGAGYHDLWVRAC